MVALPDGRVQTTRYEASPSHGYRAQVSYQPPHQAIHQALNKAPHQAPHKSSHKAEDQGHAAKQQQKEREGY